MSSTQKTLEALLRYFTHARQVGHTTVMLEGARNSECIVLAHCEQWARELKARLKKGTAIGLNSDLESRLSSVRVPLVMDNAATADLLVMALREIRDAENKAALAEMRLKASRIAPKFKGRVTIRRLLFEAQKITENLDHIERSGTICTVEFIESEKLVRAALYRWVEEIRAKRKKKS